MPDKIVTGSRFGIEQDEDESQQKEKKRSSFYEKLQEKKKAAQSPGSTPKSEKKKLSLSEQFKLSRKAKADDGELFHCSGCVCQGCVEEDSAAVSSCKDERAYQRQ